MHDRGFIRRKRWREKLDLCNRPVDLLHDAQCQQEVLAIAQTDEPVPAAHRAGGRDAAVQTQAVGGQAIGAGMGKVAAKPVLAIAPALGRHARHHAFRNRQAMNLHARVAMEVGEDWLQLLAALQGHDVRWMQQVEQVNLEFLCRAAQAKA